MATSATFSASKNLGSPQTATNNSTTQGGGGGAQNSAGDSIMLSFDPVLSQIEAHRIVAVLEKSLDRLQLLALLSHEVSALLENAASKTTPGGVPNAGAGGDNTLKGVGGILEQQQRLESRYEELLGLTADRKHNPLEPKLDMTCFKGVENVARKKHVEELRSISTSLKEQARQLCSQLKENPNDIDNWRRVVETRTHFLSTLSTCAQELSTPSISAPSHQGGAASPGSPGEDTSGINIPFQITMRYDSFARNVLGEENNQRVAEETVRREKDTNQSVKKLHQEVAAEKLKKDQELEARNATISELKQQLRALKQQTKDDMDRLRAESEANRDGVRRAAMDSQRRLRAQIDSLTEQRDIEARVSGVVISHSVSKQDWLDNLNMKWTEKQGKASKEIGDEKHRVDGERKTAKDRLDKALEHKYVEEGEKKRREEEQKRRTEDKQRRDEQKNAEFLAASKLQQTFKAFVTRQALLALKKKFKKGGKK